MSWQNSSQPPSQPPSYTHTPSSYAQAPSSYSQGPPQGSSYSQVPSQGSAQGTSSYGQPLSSYSQVPSQGTSSYLQAPSQLPPQRSSAYSQTPSQGASSYSQEQPLQLPQQNCGRPIQGGGQAIHSVIGATSKLRKPTNTDDEKHSFAEYINTINQLVHDPHLGGKVPMNPHDNSLYQIIAESILLCKFINTIRQGTIAESSICTKATRNLFEINNNHALALSGARTIGCKITNIGPEDLSKGTSHLVLGVLWQLIRLSLLSHVNLQQHPEIIALKEEGEDVNQFVNMAPEMTLLRWFNHHLRCAGHTRRITNFSGDISDGDNYTILLHQIAPLQCGLEPLQERDPLRKAEMILANTQRIGCRQFVQAQDIVNGNEKLNLAFVANLFNAHPSLSAQARLVSENEEQRNREIAAAVQQQIAQKEAELRQRMQAEESSQRNRLQQIENEWKERMKREEAAMRQKWMEEEKARRNQLQSDKEQQMTQWEREQQRKNAEWSKAQQEQNSWAQQQMSEVEREKARILEERKQLEEEKKRRAAQSSSAPWNQPAPSSSSPSQSQGYSNFSPSMQSQSQAQSHLQPQSQPQPSHHQAPLYPAGDSSFQQAKPSYIPPPTCDNPYYNSTVPMSIQKPSPYAPQAMYPSRNSNATTMYPSAYPTASMNQQADSFAPGNAASIAQSSSPSSFSNIPMAVQNTNSAFGGGAMYPSEPQGSGMALMPTNGAPMGQEQMGFLPMMPGTNANPSNSNGNLSYIPSGTQRYPNAGYR